MYLSFPATVYQTQNRFADSAADDMQSGDYSASALIALGLRDVSTSVSPYKMERLYRPGEKISAKVCAELMFDEMRQLSGLFASGHYQHLIREMIDHFQHGNGKSWQSRDVDRAFYDLIIEGSEDNAVAAVIDSKIKSGVNLEKDSFLIQEIMDNIRRFSLPKFIRFADNFNGLGITIHDIHAQHIEILYLDRTRNGWEAYIRFNAQDHFGLDREDISKFKFNQFRFFRLWFVLQRFELLAFKPFFTDFSAIVKIGSGV